MLPPPETTLSHQLHTLQRAEGEEMPEFVISPLLSTPFCKFTDVLLLPLGQQEK